MGIKVWFKNQVNKIRNRFIKPIPSMKESEVQYFSLPEETKPKIPYRKSVRPHRYHRYGTIYNKKTIW